MRLAVALDIHGHEGHELHEAGIDAAAAPGIARRHAADEVFLEPLDRLARRQLVHLRGVDARIDRPGHERHALRLCRVLRLRHDSDGGENLHARLAYGQQMGARPEHAQPLNDVVDIILEAEDAGGKGDVARIMPIGNANIVIGEQRLDRLAQEGCEVPRKRGHHQHARLSLLNVFLEMQQRPERRGGERFLGHGGIAIADANRLYAIGRARMRQPRARNELAGRSELPRPWATPLPVEWRRCVKPQRREISCRRHDVGVELIGLIKHS